MSFASFSGKVDKIFGSTVIKKYFTVYGHEISRVGFVEHNDMWHRLLQ